MPEVPIENAGSLPTGTATALSCVIVAEPISDMGGLPIPAVPVP